MARLPFFSTNLPVLKLTNKKRKCHQHTTHNTHLIRYSKVLDCIASYVAFRHPPKSISVLHYQNLNQAFSIITKLQDNKKQARDRKSNITLDVQMTSRRWMFIHVSQLTKCPLYVSPFFSSTNCYIIINITITIIIIIS